MNNNRFNNPCNRKRLARIERKCDLILSLLRPKRVDIELDRAIERMHLQAQRMKKQAEKEARFFREVFSSRKPLR